VFALTEIRLGIEPGADKDPEFVFFQIIFEEKPIFVSNF